MDDTADAAATSPATTDALAPLDADPRELMRGLLPPARAEYIKAWEWLADAATGLDKRRAGRAKAIAIADDHDVVAAGLRDRERALTGDDLLNARHLADELERHATALRKLATLSPHGLVTTGDLRPEKLGCGTRYRDPSRGPGAVSGTRGVPSRPRRDDRAGRGDRGR